MPEASNVAYVFYGELANTWTLVRAAKCHGMIKTELLAIDLLVRRQTEGRLKTEPEHGAVARCPPEIWDVIKDQVHKRVLKNISLMWLNDLKERWCDPSLDDRINRYEMERSFRHMSLIVKNITARQTFTTDDWIGTLMAEEFSEYDMSDDWDVCHSPENLRYDSWKIIEPFLALIGLKAVSSATRLEGRETGHTVQDLFTPICSKTSTGIDSIGGIAQSTSQYEYDGGQAGIADISLKNLLPARSSLKAYRILHEKYGVEFSQPKWRKEVEWAKDSSASEDAKAAKEQSYAPPRPRLILWTHTQTY